MAMTHDGHPSAAGWGDHDAMRPRASEHAKRCAGPASATNQAPPSKVDYDEQTEARTDSPSYLERMRGNKKVSGVGYSGL